MTVFIYPTPPPSLYPVSNLQRERMLKEGNGSVSLETRQVTCLAPPSSIFLFLLMNTPMLLFVTIKRDNSDREIDLLNPTGQIKNKSCKK